MTRQARPALELALALSQELLAAAARANLAEIAILDGERLRLLQSVRLDRDNLSDGDRLLLRQVAELNDRAIGSLDHNRRAMARELEMAAAGRRAVAAYSTTRQR